MAALFEKNGENWTCGCRTGAPKLYYPLPLVGTQDLGIPFAVSSARFKPVPERNGVYAGSLEDAPTRSNWLLLALVPGLYCKLLQVCGEKGWGGLEGLARFSGKFAASWLDLERFRAEVLVPCIEFVRAETGPEIVQNREAKALRVCQALVPVGEAEGALFELADRVVGIRERLPSAATHGKWAGIFRDWAPIIGAQVEELKYSLTIEGLGDRIKEVGSLDALSKLLTPAEDKRALDWLNELFEIVPESKLQGFMNSLPIVPNQLDLLKKQGDLWLDGGIDKCLKDICAELGDVVRNDLLHPCVIQRVRQLFEVVKGKTFAPEQCLERAIKRVSLPVEMVKEDAYGNGNARLLAWLIAGQRKDKLDAYPVVLAAGIGSLKAGEHLLWPVGKWAAEAALFADVFGEDRRLAECYAAHLSETDWEYLEQEGFVYRSLFTSTELNMFEQSQVKESLEAEEHEPTAPYNVARIVFLIGKSGILDGVRHSKQGCSRLLEFILRYAIKVDRSWAEGYRVNCSCKSTHTVTTGWLHDIQRREWVYVGRNRQDRPTAGNLAKVMTDELKQWVLADAEAGRFLRLMGVSLGDLARAGVPEEDQERLDRLSARIYGVAESDTLESVEAVLNDPDARASALKKRDEKQKVARNQLVGSTVEEVLKAELEACKIKVIRRPIGSDFEVESDFIENGQELAIEVSKYLVEVKSTTERYVRMTLRQGQEAVKLENRERYALCVVDVSGAKINGALIREKAKFVFEIAGAVEKEVANAATLKSVEGAVSIGGSGPVRLDIIESTLKLKVGQELWLNHGVSFDEFVDVVKKGKALEAEGGAPVTVRT